MADITYKCPSCGGYLQFNPELQNWKCPFCSSEFDSEQINEQNNKMQETQSENVNEENNQTEQFKNNKKTQSGNSNEENNYTEQSIYHCNSCGSEIVADETTVSTNCYYCHSPVVLQGKLNNTYKPDAVLPFSIGKEQATEKFLTWLKSKRFIPKKFFREIEIEKMTGVYYPNYCVEVNAKGGVDGTATRSSTYDVGKYIETRTEHFNVKREANLEFHDILRPALSSMNKKLTDGIHPFPIDKAKPFSSTYLTGFLAERQNIDAETATKDVEEELKKYVEPLLTADMNYSNYFLNDELAIRSKQSKYILLPTWVITYPNKKNRDDPYYYAMNGVTGEVCGKLPIDNKKLWLEASGIAAIVFAVACFISYFFFN